MLSTASRFVDHPVGFGDRMATLIAAKSNHRSNGCIRRFSIVRLVFKGVTLLIRRCTRPLLTTTTTMRILLLLLLQTRTRRSMEGPVCFGNAVTALVTALEVCIVFSIVHGDFGGWWDRTYVLFYDKPKESISTSETNVRRVRKSDCEEFPRF